MWRLVDAAEVRHFRRGQIVFRQGDPGGSIFVIVAGQLSVTKSAPSRVLRLALLDPPAAVGEIGVVDDKPRTATVTAVTDSILLELTRDAVFAAWDDYPEGMKSALFSLAAIARKSAEWEAAVLMDVGARIARLLLALADGAGHVVHNQVELADMLGLHRGQISKHLTEFRRLGYLAKTPGRITIINRAGLAREGG